MDLTIPGDGARAPLRVWVVSDGRIGIETQALGVAEALGRIRPVDVTVKRVLWRRALRRLPTRLIAWPQAARDPASDAFRPPWPDVVIANGRAAIPFAIGVRRWSRRATFVVQLQDPLRPPRLFDLVAPPLHDRLKGENVFPILGAPNRLTAQRLSDAAQRFPALAALPRPRVAFLVGGRSRAFDLPSARAAALADAVGAILDAEGGAFVLTFSRRTPPEARALIGARLADRPGWVWDGEGANPYFAFLAAADRFLVTADSINMVAEAASTGRPVQIMPVEGRQARKDRFHADLLARDAARPWRGAPEHWTYEPLRETERAAAAVLRRWNERRSARAIPSPEPA